jgi:5-methyltetrahydropteroyltriglutamate--homocysteine methyltransferase
VGYLDPSAVDAECADFRAALEQTESGFVEPFLTAPSPGIVAAAMKNEHYDTEEAYLEALADALRVEYEAIVGHGLLLQLDCPDLALERHISYQDRPLADFLDFAQRVVAAINRALVNVPRERVRLHVCWGNYEGPHDLDVPLAEILPIIREANVGGFVFPFANPRHAHEYRCFEGGVLADDQILVAGVIDPLTNFVEHPEVVAERIERVAAAVGDPRRVLAGTDCGFDTSAGMGRVAEDVVWAKLAALADGARLASERLF